MAVVAATDADVAILARLMRAEAEGDGKLGMLMVGNVGVNRTRARCLDFKNVNTIRSMVFQSPGGFEATQKGYFYQAAREQDKRLAKKVIKGIRYNPASYSLYFYRPPSGTDCKTQWFNQWNVGRYKSHCFYKPTQQDCPGVYGSF